MRARLLLVLVGTVALVLLVHDVPLAAHLQRVERDRLVTSLERDAFTIAGRTEEALEGGTAAQEPALADLVARYSADNDVRVVVVDSTGSAVIVSDPDGVASEDFTNRPEIVQALAGAPATGERDSVTLGESLFYVAVPVLSGDEVVGAVRLSAPERVVTDRAWDRVRGIVVVALISLAIAAAVALVLAATVTRPLRRLNAATRQLAGGDLGTRADTDEGPPEVRDLATSFNTMASRLQDLVERQRAFAGTASHQLRTPLTALRLRLEHIGTQVGDGPTADTVDEALGETDRLHRIIEGLLALSRAEADDATPEEADLVAVLRDRAEHWSALADERAVTIAVRADPATGSVAALPGSVEQIVDNLVDNALDVAPPGTRVELVAQAVGDTVEVHVVDAGPGLSDEQRRRAFDRFWRAPTAVPGGTGLGLAIVRELAEAAGGSAELRAAAGGGLDAVVTFRRWGAT